MSLYSNYPDGFSPGVVIREILGADMVPGKVFYVGNNAVLLKGERAASDGNDGTFMRPLATIDAAYDLAAAARDDLILVRPGHAESHVDATGLVMDKAGVHVVGLGHGENRPTITFATATSAAIPVSGANNSISNFVFKCNIASQVHMLDVKADDFLVNKCEFREGTATGLSFINADTADGDSDRLHVVSSKFHAPTAGNMDQAIFLGKDHTGVRIVDVDIFGDFDVAGIAVPTAGNAQVDLRILDCRIQNLLTGQFAIEIIGTASTGQISRCLCQTDAIATCVDTGGLPMFETYAHDGADQSYAIVIGTAVS
jgi:hypothetical protein